MMKIYSALILVVLFSAKALCDSVMSVEEFKKLSWDEQAKVILVAKDADKAKWTKIYRQAILEKKWGGKVGYEVHKGDLVIVAKGLAYLMTLLDTQQQVWHAYANNEIIEAGKRGVSLGTLRKMDARLDKMEKDLANRNEKRLRPILIGLVPGPRALALERIAEPLVRSLDERYNCNNPAPIKLEDLQALDKTILEITTELESLPMLSQEQVAAQYAALPEEELMK